MTEKQPLPQQTEGRDLGPPRTDRVDINTWPDIDLVDYILLHTGERENSSAFRNWSTEPRAVLIHTVKILKGELDA